MPGSADRQALAAALRTDLVAFTMKAFQTVSPGDRYQHNWHVEAICHELRRCRDGDNTRLLVTQPPRSLKSICSSVAFVAWALGHNPSLRFICVSYAQDLATDLTRQFRMVVDSDWYKATFPAMRLARDTGTQCVTTAGGGRTATSIGGTLTGRGADLIIVDDPLKASDAQSETARKQVIDWYAGTLVTRLNDKRKGAIVVVMQRLHEEDLAGYLLAGDDWHHLDLPAIAVADQRIRIGPKAQDVHRRQTGALLHPDREPRESLDRIKTELGSLAFSAQYQQRPVPLEGNLVKRDWFRRYERAPKTRRIVQSWDVASSVNEHSDWSVCTTWATDGKDYYLLAVWRDRLEYPALKRKVVALQQHHDAQTVLVETVGLGLNLYQDLQDEPTAGFPRPIGIVPKGDKVTRMEAEAARIENGQVLLPQEAPWLDSFLTEVLAFPYGKHDDQVDSLSQFLQWAVRRGGDGPMYVPGELFIGDDDD